MIKMQNAVFLWDIKTKRFDVADHGQILSAGQYSLPSSYGACNTEWPDFSTEQRIIQLLSLMLKLTAKEGFELERIYEALEKIEEFEDYRWKYLWRLNIYVEFEED